MASGMYELVSGTCYLSVYHEKKLRISMQLTGNSILESLMQYLEKLDELQSHMSHKPFKTKS